MLPSSDTIGTDESKENFPQDETEYMLQSITKITTTILTLATFAGIAFFGFKNGFERLDRYMDLKAIQDCTSSYQQTITDEETGTVRNRPLEQQARECAVQKGVENWDGVWSDLLQ